jgi:hypothetical protein
VKDDDLACGPWSGEELNGRIFKDLLGDLKLLFRLMRRDWWCWVGPLVLGFCLGVYLWFHPVVEVLL